jgi:hypothetical protein
MVIIIIIIIIQFMDLINQHSKGLFPLLVITSTSWKAIDMRPCFLQDGWIGAFQSKAATWVNVIKSYELWEHSI